MLSTIVCMSENRVIGVDGKLPWHLPKDMQRFRKLTIGHPIIMGRKTHESIGRMLPGRKNIVLTRQEDYISPGCIVANKLHDIQVHTKKESEIFVIGGESVYQTLLPASYKLYLTVVHTELEGDTFFPRIDRSQWECETEEFVPKDHHHQWDMTFSTWHRK